LVAIVYAGPNVLRALTAVTSLDVRRRQLLLERCLAPEDLPCLRVGDHPGEVGAERLAGGSPRQGVVHDLVGG
jgi:hypothetical protein